MSIGFTDSFRALAGFMNRPTSDVLLFSGVPFDPVHPSTEEIERLSSRIGLDVKLVSHDEFRRRAFELPLLLFFDDGRSLALFEEDPLTGELLSENGNREIGRAHV